MRRFLDYDPLTGITTHFSGSGDGKFEIMETQDVTSIIEHNKRLLNLDGYKRGGIKNGYYHFATVPNVVMHKIMKDHNVNPFNREDLPKIERILKSNEYRYLRTVDKI